MSDFRTFKEFATSLSVANNSAERNFTLLQNLVIANNKLKLRQDLILIFENQRKEN